MFDYIFGAVLLLAPTLFSFSQFATPSAVARIIGLLLIVQALFTNHEFGLLKVLPMRAHLIGDYVLFIILALSPWLFSFHNLPNNAWLPHLCVGLLGSLGTFMTQREPRRIGWRSTM
jgi:hypothetical protein